MAIFGSVPYAFTNGAVADATQVNADFAKIISDGNAGCAAKGVNSDITELTAITDINILPAGTAMVFVQAAAPTGWTKSATNNNKALRLVTGASGGTAGGSVAFSTVFARTATDSHVLSVAEMPSHNHGGATGANGSHDHTYSQPTPDTSNWQFGSDHYGISVAGGTTSTVGNHTHTISSQGSGSGHTHGIDMRLQYVDAIVCTKD
jgi:hypothetical protein